MSHIIRVPNEQSRSRRVYETRRVNYEEASSEYRVVLNSEFAAADTTAEGGASFGSAVLVDGYERLHVYLEHVAGTTTTAVHVAVQCATWDDKNPVAADLQWFDLYEDEAGTGALVRKVYDLTTSADAKVSWKIPRIARFMRFKVWTTGANRAGSRILLLGSRIMEAA